MSLATGTMEDIRRLQKNRDRLFVHVNMSWFSVRLICKIQFKSFSVFNSNRDYKYWSNIWIGKRKMRLKLILFFLHIFTTMFKNNIIIQNQQNL